MLARFVTSPECKASRSSCIPGLFTAFPLILASAHTYAKSLPLVIESLSWRHVNRYKSLIVDLRKLPLTRKARPIVIQPAYHYPHKYRDGLLDRESALYRSDFYGTVYFPFSTQLSPLKSTDWLAFPAERKGSRSFFSTREPALLHSYLKFQHDSRPRAHSPALVPPVALKPIDFRKNME